MITYSDPTHFWTIGAIEKTQGLSLSGPSLITAQQTIQSQARADMVSVLGEMRGDIRSDLKSRLDQAKSDFRSRLRE